MTTESAQTRNTRIEALLQILSEGNAAAMGQLYDLIRTDVFAYALSKTGNRHDAEDVTQDTFVRVYKYAKQYRPQGKPMAWIITIERNLISRRFQLNQRTVSFDDRLNDAPDTGDFEQRVINNEFLRRLLSNLDETEREIIVLHIVSGLKHREIAKLLNKPLSTVLSKYNRAIKKLQAIVKEKK